MTLSLFLIEVAIEMLFKLDSKVVFFFCVELEHEAHRGSIHCSQSYYCLLKLALWKSLKVAELISSIGHHLGTVGYTP